MMKNIPFILILPFFVPLFSFGQTAHKEFLGQGDSLYDLRRYSEALELFYTAEKNLIPSKDTVLLASSYYRIGQALRQVGKNDSAIVYHQKMEQLSMQIKNDSLHALALHGKGLTYAKMMQYDRAVELYETSLELLKNNIADPRTEAVVLNGLAGVYIASNDIGNTLKFSQRALKRIRETDDYELHANILNTISICYEKEGVYQKALSYKQESLRLCNEKGLEIPIILLANIGKSFFLLKKHDSALAYYKKAKEKSIENKFDYGLARINHRIAMVYSELNDLQKSLYFLRQSHEHFSTIQDGNMLGTVSKDLSDVYLKMGNPERSLSYLKEHLKWSDTIQKRTQEKKLEEFQIKYATEEKENEITYLEKENSLKAQVAQSEMDEKRNLRIILSGILAAIAAFSLVWFYYNRKKVVAEQTNLRFQMVLDAEEQERKRLALSLQKSIGDSILKLEERLNLLKNHFPATNKPLARLLDQTRRSYKELLHISNNMMPETFMAKGLAHEIDELVNGLPKNTNIKVKVNVHEYFDKIPKNNAINIYRIIQEAMVNILKYANATTVTINLSKDNTEFRISIKDDGVGIPKAKIENLDGLGWKNIHSRVEALQGNISILSAPDEGTEIQIKIAEMI